MRKILRPLSQMIRSVLGINGLSDKIDAIVLANRAMRDQIRAMAGRADASICGPVNMVHSHLESPRREVESVVAAIRALESKIGNLDGRLDALARQLPEKAKLAPDTALVSLALPNGTPYELSVDQANADAYHAAVPNGGTADRNWYFLNAWTRPGDVFFDLGANIGTISIPMAVLGAEVHAFELLDANIQHLRRSVEANSLSHISIMLGAVTDKEGYLGVGGYSAWGTVVRGALISVPGVVIDTYVKRQNISKVDTMKIDVEGSEYAALRGSVSVIERDHPDIIIECNAITCGGHGYSYRDLLRFLQDFGYRIYRLHKSQLAPWNPSLAQEVIIADYLATVRDPNEICERSGWQIGPISKEDIIANIEEQDRQNAWHKKFVLVVRDRLDPSVVAEPRVAELLSKWAQTEDNSGSDVIRTGSR